MISKITSERDEVNIRLLHNIKDGMPFCASRCYYLLRDGTPEDRAEYVRKFHRRMMLAAVVVVGYFTISYMIPRAPTPVIPPPISEAAGVVQDIQLHSAFFTETTVKTSTGIFQVRGGVSASIGDEAQIKRESNSLLSLCIQSQIKTACYSIL